MAEDSISLDLKKIKGFFLDKKVQTVFVAILFLLTLYVGVSIRTSGLDNLIDPTTNDYTPLALDPYYFLRISETLISNEGILPEIDGMRYQSLNPGWSTELTPYSTVLIYKLMKGIYPETTLNYATVLNPVIFFALGLIVFFFLSLLITKNKWAAVISSFILAIIPPYLYRTLAGFADHESIGMVGFFLVLLSFNFGLFYIEKKKSSGLYAGLIGLIAGIFTSFAIAAWGGGAKFLFMIAPLTFLIIWLTREDKNKKNYLLFYGLWIVAIFLSSGFFGETLSNAKSFTLGSTGILTFAALGYALIDSILIKYKLLNKNFSKYQKLISFGILIVVGSIFYEIFVGGVFDLIKVLIERVINPFGSERVTLTVAENKQPYLSEWIGQIGNTLFYTFLLGAFIVGTKLAKGIKIKKYKFLFTGSFFLFILGILYSRISSGSILNGDNFLSKALFLTSFLIFTISSIYIHTKSDWKIDSKWIMIAAWMIPMLLAVRSAIRVFFAIVPFVALMVPIAIFEVGKFAKKTKDDVLKLVSYIVLAILIIGLIYTLLGPSGFYNSVKYQSENQRPSYNSDWQKAMSWVRDNTSEEGIFLHWWDYGYWVQTGGNRPTVTDGGHYNAFWDHLIGRYVLTTPNPDTAKSFMKSHNVSYLLIDPTDIGKYGAFSSIGNDADEADRQAWLPTMIADPAQTQETRNGTTKIYSGGFYLDSDIIFEQDGKKIFLPKGKAALGGVIIEKIGEGYSQPIGIFVYNNNQYRFPIRYVANEGMNFDFGSGINSTAYIYPNVVGQNFDPEGALMYLSERTMNSLVAKLYLMGDADGEYSELELVHSEGAYPFNFYYGGFRGPIRIWKVNEMPDIMVREEFLRKTGEYGEFDDLIFKK